MNAVHRIFNNGVPIERVTFLRATLNEANEMYENLIDDIADYDRIIVDLSLCNYIDSSFFGALINAYKKMREKDGSIVIVLSNMFITKSFLYNDISSIFNVYHSVRCALDSLNISQENVHTNEYMNLNSIKEPDKLVQFHTQLVPKFE